MYAARFLALSLPDKAKINGFVTLTCGGSLHDLYPAECTAKNAFGIKKRCGI